MKRFLQNLALFLASGFIGLMILEVGLRIYDDEPFWPIENLVGKRNSMLRYNMVVRYDELVGWVWVENYVGRPGKLTETSGQYGIRMNSPKIEPIPKNAILAVGDSFTSGSGVSDGETWPAQLERLLGEPVVNTAAGGYATDQMVLRLESLIPVLEPHTVIMAIMVDDILRAQMDKRGGTYKPYFMIKDGELVHMNYPVPHYVGTPRDVGYVRAVFGYSYFVNWMMDRIGYTGWWEDWDVKYHWAYQEGGRVSCLLLDRLKKQGDAKKFRVVAAFLYGAPHVRGKKEPPVHQREVKQCAEDLGIDVVDTWDAYKEIQETDPARFCQLYSQHDDKCKLLGHPSPEGYGLIAKEIEKVIRSQ